MTMNAITHTHTHQTTTHRTGAPTERPNERPNERTTGDGRARRREVGPSVRRSVGRRARRARRVRPSHRRVDVRFGFGVGTGTGTGTPGTEFRRSVRDDGRTTKMSSRKSTPDSLEDDDGRSDEEDVGDEVRDDEDEGVGAGRTVFAFSLLVRFFFFARESSSVRGVDADRWMDRSVRARGVRARVRVRAVEREDGRAWIGG